MSEFMTTADVAKVLDVTPAAVRLIVKRGELQAAASTESGIRLFNRETVEALARERAEREGGGDGDT